MVIVAEEGHRNIPSTSFRINPEYAQMAELVPGLYICGVSSLTPENMERYNISLIINATNEVWLLETFLIFVEIIIQN